MTIENQTSALNLAQQHDRHYLAQIHLNLAKIQLET